MVVPQVSVIVAARNEEANVSAAVESLAAQTVPVELIVVNDCSTDRTGAILAELSAKLPQLRVVETHGLPAGWTGKNHALARGVEEARAPWLLFTDADVRHAPRALEKGLALARETGADVVSFSPQQAMRTWWERAVIPFVYCRLAEEYPYQQVSDAQQPQAAANGQWLLVRRDVYQTVGGHAAVRSEILEDVALARRLKRFGYRLHFALGVGVARTRMYRHFGRMWEGWSKNLFLLFQRRKRAVVASLGGATLEGLAALLLLLGLAGMQEGGPASFLLLLFGAGIAVFRHARYAQALRRNRFPWWCIFYYTVGSILFALLLASSAAKHLSGEPLKWKGRDYAVTAK